MPTYSLPNDGRKLGLISSGFPSEELTEEEARKILEGVIGNASDAELEADAERVATDQVQVGRDHDEEYAFHLAHLKRERARIQARMGRVV